MTEALVSILVPCRNAEKYIAETLTSALQQTWRRVEIIVADDGSTDQSTAIVEGFKDPRVRLIRQAGPGVCAARNTALACASGDYIQYLDADDLITPDKIAIQLERLIDQPNAIASGEWGRFYHDPRETKFDPEPTWKDLDPLDWIALAWQDGIPMHCVHGWLLPRAVCDAAGPWNESILQNTDGEYFTRVILSADRVLFCPSAQAMYRSGLPGSVSRQASAAYRESRFLALHLCETHILARDRGERTRRGLALAWQHFAHFCYPYDTDIAEHALARARALHPVEISPSGGPTFVIAATFLGWRVARKLQLASGRR